MTNTFENMCKELNKRKICNNHTCIMNNEYICAKQAVEKYTNGNRNELLKLKSEAITSDWWAFNSTLIAIFSMFISIVTLLYTTYRDTFPELEPSIIGIILLILTILVFIIILYNISSFRCVAKWKGYILVAIEELESKNKES